MIKAIQKHLKNRKGFTLIELIVVIVILGILAAILIPTFGGYADKAKAASDDAIAANIKTTIAVAYAEGKFTSLEFSVTDNGKVTLTDVEGAAATFAASDVEALITLVYPNLTDVDFTYYASYNFKASSAGVTFTPVK